MTLNFLLLLIKNPVFSKLDVFIWIIKSNKCLKARPSDIKGQSNDKTYNDKPRKQYFIIGFIPLTNHDKQGKTNKCKKLKWLS